MPLRTDPARTWFDRLDPPNRPFGSGDEAIELVEERDAYVLTVELPGFDVDAIDVRWADETLVVAAEQDEDDRKRTRTFHRRFRFPKAIEEGAIDATYENGVLEVRLPIEGLAERGREITVES